MSAPAELAQPGAPPSVPGPLGEAEPAPLSVPDADEARTALALAAAFLLAAGAASAWLARAEPDLSGAAAAQAWDAGGQWLPAATPALARAYTGGGLSAEQADRAATAYAASLGEHLADTSGQALMEGFTTQLAARWPARTAWARAAAGYGLDGPSMLAWIKHLMLGERPPDAARVHDLLMARALRLGDTEAFRARNSGRALGWVWMQRTGLLGADAAKMWRTARDELTCPFCLSLDGQTVGLDEPFTYPDGTQIFCPPSHPNCRCIPDLTTRDPLGLAPQLTLVGKAVSFDDDERRARSERAHTAARNPDGEFAHVDTRDTPATPDTQGPSGFAQTKSGFAARSGFAQATQAQSGFAARSGFTQTPSGFAQAKSGFAQAKLQAQTDTRVSGFARTRTSGFTNVRARPRTQILLYIPGKPGIGGQMGAPAEWALSRSALGYHLGYDIPALIEPDENGLISFDDIAHEAGLEKSGFNPDYQPDYVAVQRHPGLHGPVPVLIDEPDTRAAHFWLGHNPVPARAEAEMTAHSLTAAMNSIDIDTIYRNSGWDLNANHNTETPLPTVYSMSREGKLERLRDAVNNPRTIAEQNLAEAYLDYVVYRLPQQPAQDIYAPNSKLKTLREQMLDYMGGSRGQLGSVDFSEVPIQDVYTFNNGFNTEAAGTAPQYFTDGKSGNLNHILRGTYRVDSVRYQPLSNLTYGGRTVPRHPGIAAVRYINLTPTS